MSATLADVHNDISQGQYRSAAQKLQSVLETNPTADAWFMAAQFTVENDRDRAVRHLKRALMLNPRHNDSLNLLRQMGEQVDFTLGDVAEEFGDQLGERADKAPILRWLSRPQQLIFIIMVIMVVVLSLIWAKNIFFPYQGPANIPDVAPQAVEVTIHDADALFNRMLDSDFTILAIQYVSSSQVAGRRILRFSVPGANSDLESAQLVVYSSISALARDSASHRDWEQSNNIVASGTALLVYSKNLEGLVMEDRLINRFHQITAS